ncbi:CLUMA_CG012336, isoform A [Clunio marinus]|uniref:CLUMA_CG012336, isoform A n=1 Tax=Clunio marinus TaxID=568069 RepID=A0A1J1IFS8_9DIPT|nr:CLUMA_CG012336, isoform A [Clunio marinus]
MKDERRLKNICFTSGKSLTKDPAPSAAFFSFTTQVSELSERVLFYFDESHQQQKLFLHTT